MESQTFIAVYNGNSLEKCNNTGQLSDLIRSNEKNSFSKEIHRMVFHLPKQISLRTQDTFSADKPVTKC